MKRKVFALVVGALALPAASLAVINTASAASAAVAPQPVSYSATVTIPVPPASNYAGSGGGDGWGVALTPTAVYNVFHHQTYLAVACHFQSNAAPCWSPKTITDSSGGDFATSGQPGLWMDQANGHLYVFATNSKAVGGVVCIDTTAPAAATGAQLFCGFTPLTGPGESFGIDGNISGISNPVAVGSKLYAFNYVNGVAPTGAENRLLCFDESTLHACASQPYAMNIGSGAVSIGSFPASNAIAAIGTQVVVPVLDGTQEELACYDPTKAGASCTGHWPVDLSFAFSNDFGAPFPMLSATGALIGLCLPTGTDQCYTLGGAPATTPPHMASVVTASDNWNGPALTLGPRVYVPNGTVGGDLGAVQCFDYSTNASCANFPKTFTNLDYLYTVSPDPQRPTCIWVNADGGADQIQNFDAFTGGACGQGDIRVLASSVVVNTPRCTPGAWTSLQVLAPSRASYSSGTVAFEDGDANPIPGAATRALDNTGSTSLAGLNLQTPTGLPQFLITLHGETGTPGSVLVKLTWQGVYDPSCILTGTNVTGLGVNGVMMLAGDGGMFAFGQRGFLGAASVRSQSITTPGGTVLPSPFTGLATKGGGGSPGYFDVIGTGQVFPVGSASNYGDARALRLAAPIVGIASTADGRGYWLVGSDGGVLSYGDAHFHGSLGGVHLNAPIVSIVRTSDGAGYWLIGADGGVFGFGDAHYRGSLGGVHLNAPITGAARTPDGGGYYLVGRDGGVFAFGDAHYRGSMGGHPLNAPIVAIALDGTGNGYWLVGGDGGVFTEGDAPYQGSLPASGVHLRYPIVGAVNS